jgi:predicted dienelactone hydrolase
MMAWYGAPLARAGYVVVAVDHPGNNGLDRMTVAGATMSWDRARDLRAALEQVKADPEIGPHLNAARVGATGFSAGGFTSLVAAGARVDMQRFVAFCRAHPEDGVCKPQKEFVLTIEDAQKALAAPELAAEAARSGEDLSIPGLKAAFAIAPAIVQALTPDSLKAVKVPVMIFLGASDPVAPPDTNGRVAAKAIPHARLKELPGVKHYDFLATCTDAGRAAVEICRDERPQDPTHDAAIEAALDFFGKTLGKP